MNKEINIVTVCEKCKARLEHFAVIRDIDNNSTINLFVDSTHKCKVPTNPQPPEDK